MKKLLEEFTLSLSTRSLIDDADAFWTIRHGYGDHNHYKDLHGEHPKDQDPNLHEIGYEQTASTGEALSIIPNININAVICGPLIRMIASAISSLSAMGYKGEIIIEPMASEWFQPNQIMNLGSPKDVLKSLFEDKAAQAGLILNFSRLPDGQWWPNDWETPADLEARIQTLLDYYFVKLGLKPNQTALFTHRDLLNQLTGAKNYPNGGLARVNYKTRDYKMIFTPEPAPLRSHEKIQTHEELTQ